MSSAGGLTGWEALPGCDGKMADGAVAWGFESELEGVLPMELSQLVSLAWPLRFTDGKWSVQGYPPEFVWAPGPTLLLCPLPWREPSGLRASCCQAAQEAVPPRPGVGKAWVRSAWGLLSSLAQLSSLPTGQNDLFKAAADDWVLLNINVTGYYQVNYDENNWKKIQNQLMSSPEVGACRPMPSTAQGPVPRWQPRLQGLPHGPPEVTCSIAPSRTSLSSTGRRSSMTASTWPGECPPLLPRAPLVQQWKPSNLASVTP